MSTSNRPKTKRKSRTKDPLSNEFKIIQCGNPYANIDTRISVRMNEKPVRYYDDYEGGHIY